MGQARVLIVDDEAAIRKVLSAHLVRDGFEVETAEDGHVASEMLRSRGFEAVITDLRMPKMDGMQLLSWCCANVPGLPVLILTAHGTVDSAVEAIKLGAQDYITKPFDHDELRQALEKALAVEQKSRHEPQEPQGSDHLALVGTSPAMQGVLRLIRKVADSPTTVLLQGETGTGKELVARAIHNRSTRRSRPFIHVNCGAIPINLFESELFGYERGAFTGAVGSKQGRFELAQGGTIFLDEISELPKEMQVKLLRVLQEHTFERVGGLRTLSVDARVIAATNVDLAALVASGAFREDLFYRLNVVLVAIPPLRDRPEDVPLLVEHFREKYRLRTGLPPASFSAEVLAALARTAWSGNVRELENVVERALLLSEGPEVGMAEVFGSGTLTPGAAPPRSATPPSPVGGAMDLHEYLHVATARLERERIAQALLAEKGNVTWAARRLGISRKSLQVKMKEYGLREP